MWLRDLIFTFLIIAQWLLILVLIIRDHNMRKDQITKEKAERSILFQRMMYLITKDTSLLPQEERGPELRPEVLSDQDEWAIQELEKMNAESNK